ncbi:MAG: type 1 glutamine amidotransferase [Gammaproteobacteria bacterium]
MKPVLIFRHIACEGPGYLANILSSRNIPFNVILVDEGDQIPDSLDNVAGLVFMGGPMSVNDPLTWIDTELKLIQNAHEKGIPMLGHCLGGQLISKALGGPVGPNPVQEIGWFPVSRCESCLAPHWLDGLPESFNVFHLHGDVFSIPQGASLLLKSQYCQHQAFVIGNTLALQFHLEVTEDLLLEWIDVYRNDIEHPSESVQSAEQIMDNLQNKISEVHQYAEILYNHWLNNF